MSKSGGNTQGLPTHEETAGPVRLAQSISVWVYGALLVVALGAGFASLFASDHPSVGALSACAGALSAAGFVLHDRPRVLSKRWDDLYWDPDMEKLAREGYIDYGSEASAVWVIEESAHRKGRFPTVRLIERISRGSSWSEVGVATIVNPRGDITIAADVSRSAVDAGREVAVIIT